MNGITTIHLVQAVAERHFSLIPRKENPTKVLKFHFKIFPGIWQQRLSQRSLHKCSPSSQSELGNKIGQWNSSKGMHRTSRCLQWRWRSVGPPKSVHKFGKSISVKCTNRLLVCLPIKSYFRINPARMLADTVDSDSWKRMIITTKCQDVFLVK